MSVSEIQARSAKRARRSARRAVLGAFPLSLVLHAAALTGWLAAGGGPRAMPPRRVTVPEVALRWTPALVPLFNQPGLARPPAFEPPTEPLPILSPRDVFTFPQKPEELARAPLPWRAAEFEVTSIVRPRVPAEVVGPQRAASHPPPPPLAADPALAEPTSDAPPGEPSRDPATASVTPPVPRDDNDPPYYPASAQRRGHQGLVLVLVLVGADGSALEVSLAASSGHASLDNAALDALRNWRFEPAQRAGQPVEQELEVPVRFRLRG